MKQPEQEQRMKAGFDENEFSPKEGDWEKMQQALKPKRSSVLLLLPFSKAVAAAAVLVALGTSGLYLFFFPAGKQGTIALSAPEPHKPTPLHEQATAHKPRPAEQAPPTRFTGLYPPYVQPGKTASKNTPVPTEPTENDTYTARAEQEPPQQEQSPAVLPSEERRPTKPFRNTTVPTYNPYRTASGNNTLRLGLAAGVGKPTLGDIQYNVSVVARQPLGNHFFAEANVSLSSGNINYSEKGALRPLPGGGTGTGVPSDGVNNVTSSVDLNYVSNIISVGVAPSLGYKITSNLSVSGGADVYKALNRELKYQAGNNIPDKSSYSLPIPQRSITDWDFGLKAQAEFRFNQNFSFSTQYRQGLTQYILIDGRSLKNSNFTIGLKYYLLKVR